MKRIFYTQRVEIIENYNERRDAADQRIPLFLSACGFLPMPLPNLREVARQFCEELSADGIFLTGGNSLISYGGNAPERDAVERSVLRWAAHNSVPVFGICRGMQMIADFLGSEMGICENHVRTRHAINGRIKRQTVNSYHTLTIKNLSSDLVICGSAPDGSIEAVCHASVPVAGIMWHPEREEPFNGEDLKMIRNFYAEGRLR